tara:strand:+ start:10771 stop:11124 length:354 start_codon:yes stop_codon:yes gene_type:complete
MGNEIECEMEVKGRVQGVGFRFMTGKKCRDLKLRGWVSNQEGGDVLILVQGEKSHIESLIFYLKTSPGISHVQEVDYSFRECGNRFEDFKVLREEFVKDQKVAFINFGKSLGKKNGK